MSDPDPDRNVDEHPPPKCKECGRSLEGLGERFDYYVERGYCRPKCWDMTYWYLK